jgi:transposase
MSPLYNTGMDRRIELSQKQVNRAHVLTRLINDRTFTIPEAAQAMGVSERQAQRMKGEYKKIGIEALVHKNIGRKPANAICEEDRQKIIELKQSSLFEKANFLFFQELLARAYGIEISYSALHRILTSAGIRSVKTRRPSQKHRRRKRKAREGLMLQIDASPFDWLNHGEMFSLHGAIDDATGKPVALYLCKNECLQGYFEVMRNVITNNGIPVSIYADRHAIFVSPKDGKFTIEEELKGIQAKDTQFGRALRQLGISLIKARSPQAKGRIERLWETLQGRLPIEFRLAGIQDVDTANAFLADYVKDLVNLFAVNPEDNDIAYRPISPAMNLENILCVTEKRSFDNGGVFSFHNRTYQIVPPRGDRLLPGKGSIDVLVSPLFGVRASFMGVVFETVSYVKPEKAMQQTASRKKGKYIPPESHYYKYGHCLMKKVTFEDNDRAILKMLERVFLGKIDDAG